MILATKDNINYLVQLMSDRKWQNMYPQFELMKVNGEMREGMVVHVTDKPPMGAPVTTSIFFTKAQFCECRARHIAAKSI